MVVIGEVGAGDKTSRQGVYIWEACFVMRARLRYFESLLVSSRIISLSKRYGDAMETSSGPESLRRSYCSAIQPPGANLSLQSMMARYRHVHVYAELNEGYDLSG